jgi:hypothetical protein
MKRTLIMFLFVLYSFVCFAPSSNTAFILMSEPVKTITIQYDLLIEAISWHESKNQDSAINVKEMALGRLQIRKCRIEHYNRLTGKNYTHEDMYNFRKAKEVFLYFAKGKTYEQAAKSWNGSGPMTEIYWNKIKSILAT